MAFTNIIKLSKLSTILVLVLALCFEASSAFENESEDYYDTANNLKSFKYNSERSPNISKVIPFKSYHGDYHNKGIIIPQINLSSGNSFVNSYGQLKSVNKNRDGSVLLGKINRDIVFIDGEVNKSYANLEHFRDTNKSVDINPVESKRIVNGIESKTLKRSGRSTNYGFPNKTSQNYDLMFLGITNEPNSVSDGLKTTNGFSVSSGFENQAFLNSLENEFITNESGWNFDQYFENMSSKKLRSEDDSEMSFTTENMLFFSENLTEDCLNGMEFCNLTREEYEMMLLEFIYPKPFEWVLIGTHAMVFFIGLVGNALVCIAVYRNHSMRTVTNYFIVNLAVADFMVILICLPPTVLWDVTKTWFFGTALCRLTLYFQSVSVTVSVLTLTFISMDRWYAICFPLKFKSTTGRAKTAILVIWLISLLFNLPELVVLEAQRSKYVRFDLWYLAQCTPTWSVDSDLKWHIAKALFLYTFPLLLMMIAYCQIVRVLWRSDNIPGHTEAQSTGNNLRFGSSANRRNTMSIHTNASTEGQLRSRRKAAKMLVAVVVMFAVCYFPVHLLSVLRYLFAVQQSDVITFISLLSHVMCYANSAVNPLIYNFMSGLPGFSGKFRREFHRTFFKCHCWNGNALDRNGTSFAPIGSSRTGTMRTFVRRNDSCMSYRLTRLSPSDTNGFQASTRNTTSSFIENNNSSLNGRKNPVISRLGEFAPDKELIQSFPNRFSPLPTADPDVNSGKD